MNNPCAHVRCEITASVVLTMHPSEYIGGGGGDPATDGPGEEGDG